MALSPMMQQYLQTKDKYSDSILFFRLGDFYEMFFEDAKLCSKLLDLTLTGKDCGVEERAPMCGIPYHAAESYIAKLVDMGYKVAICEQTTVPTKGNKIVERDVVRIVTPGTVIDSNMLEENKNNYIMCAYFNNSQLGVSYVDISTGIMYLTEFLEENALSQFNDLLIQVQPKEILYNSDFSEIIPNLSAIKLGIGFVNGNYDDSKFELNCANEMVLNQFGKEEIKQKGAHGKSLAISSCGALLNYLLETQKRSLNHINTINVVETSNFMHLDANTRKNLELTESNNRDRKKKGSLLWLLDKTKTNMGARTLRSYVEQPLYNEQLINKRLNAVEELCKNIIIRENLANLLSNVYDIERLCGKVSYGNLSPKDCIALLRSLKQLPNIKSKLESFNSSLLKEIYNNIFDYSEIVNLLDSAIIEDPPFKTSDGGFIKNGFNKELDDVRNISTVGKTWLAGLEAKEKQETGIKNLKIAFNKVFGYYIEVTKSQLNLVPFRYQRKQTTVNSERFITDELKEIEDKILNAQDKCLELELKLYEDIKNVLKQNIVAMQQTARHIGVLDALLSLANVACVNNYCKPTVKKNVNKIEIVDGRHPVVEAILKDEDFVPNNTLLDDNENRTMIITGPNMAGKSTYMRQVALITLMAHIGSFVPAKSATISLTDRIFTRVGASDDLAFGQSTFMVEMSEVSNILKNATNNSLIILDEVGRGTSTFDGLSIAWSVMEYISKTLKAKTLFATHYHELTELEGMLDGVKNYRINVKEFNNSIIFLRKIVRGGANKSFGIEVASLAGIPKDVVNRAREILHTLEENEINTHSNLRDLGDAKENHEKIKANNEVVSILKDIDVNTLSPLQAFDTLINLINIVKK